MSTPGSLAEWNPGLDGPTTLRAAYDEMPGDDASVIPWRVKLLENPASPVALPGAVDLFGHDCIHIVLGRGTLPQDEAFVVGATMGASGELAGWQQQLFKMWARRTYRGAFRLSRTDLQVFDLAVEFARGGRVKPLHRVAWRDLLDQPLDEIRTSLGIDTARLIAVYEAERALWPLSSAAQRLPRSSAAVTAPGPDASPWTQ
ncbi:hypothetical protein ACFVZM_08705 [Streptomyces sioyaensis]|uniref:hypothetical protein n=1 Tax=Streptomyces sioyaensis TaxID=67364 RepID=UPI0036756960